MHDVFLSYNSKDENDATKIARQLESAGASVWFAPWKLVPGDKFQKEIEEAIDQVRSVAILIGPHGLGPWHEAEIRAFLVEDKQREVRVIPVLLPGLKQNFEIPKFLGEFQWLDLRGGISTKGLKALAAVIRPTSESEATENSDETVPLRVEVEGTETGQIEYLAIEYIRTKYGTRYTVEIPADLKNERVADGILRLVGSEEGDHELIQLLESHRPSLKISQGGMKLTLRGDLTPRESKIQPGQDVWIELTPRESRLQTSGIGIRAKKKRNPPKGRQGDGDASENDSTWRRRQVLAFETIGEETMFTSSAPTGSCDYFSWICPFCGNIEDSLESYNQPGSTCESCGAEFEPVKEEDRWDWNLETVHMIRRMPKAAANPEFESKLLSLFELEKVIKARHQSLKTQG